MAINEDIMIANEIIDGKKIHNTNIFHNNSSIYKFTNENISGYYDLIDFKKKEVLTVCSSGDHVLESILRDVKRVDCFDISIFTKYFMNLKLASICTLEYVDFYYYLFNQTNTKIFSIETYDKIRKTLKDIDFDSLKFWDNLYDNHRGFKIYLSQLFMSNYIDISIFQNKSTSYLNREKYYILKEKLEKYLSLNGKIKFVQSSIIDIDKSFKEKYDLIFLSNIASYMEDIYRKDSKDNFYDLIINKINNLLKENGLIEVAYLYSYVTLKDFTNDCLNNNKFQIMSFDSFYRGQKSYILTYKK